MQLTENNYKLLVSMGLNVRTKWDQLVHKVYHCIDHGREDRGRLKYEVELKENQAIQRTE